MRIAATRQLPLQIVFDPVPHADAVEAAIHAEADKPLGE